MDETGADRPDPRLTDLEVAVLQLVSEGATNRMIASQLGLSVDEVKATFQALLIKLYLTLTQDGHMDEAQLLAHLRSTHGNRRRRVRKLEDLRLRHLFIHIARTRIEETDPTARADRERTT